MTNERNLIPLMIDLSGRNVVIIGGGSVGERKAALFSRYADTTVVSVRFTTKLEKMKDAGKLNLVQADLSSLPDDKITELISNAFLVIPATNNIQLNDRIVDIARKSDILINKVDSVGDVVVPSVITRGKLTIGISTLGSSPALSKYARKKIEQIITPQYADMIRLQDEMRTYLKQHVPDQEDRKDILWKILENEDVWNALSESYEKAYNIAHDIILKQMTD
ncbi:MAG: bifunctional precorrin-2 dehydrogenase/sirohydrochlorin ferrochelatase [Methanosarcinaceae archaeon]|nr:bifunctional precorrin-2 dehydrogenase/sirohydrochlorin ferrochelatase [Methanosarcinaceae archaeon]MDF1533807.1 bifunctional precorrin-2 dehydrogenase/sirohydrochlorin ferrochelatase [Methanosarcinaceae archaeon]